MVKNIVQCDMAKLSSENTDALKYFRAYLLSWLEKSGLNKTVAAQRLGVGQSQLNEILNGKRGVSLFQMEKFCKSLGTSIPDALTHGRKLIGESKEDKGLNKNQIEAIEAFKFVLLPGGEAAELLAESTFNLARRKQTEAELQNPTPARDALKSAS